MKEYFNIKDRRRVVEYDLSDWEKGLWSADAKYTRPWPIHQVNTGEIYYAYLPPDQLELIKAKRKEVYWQRVNNLFVFLKEKFDKVYQESLEQLELLDIEINRMNKILKEDKKELYETLIIRNKPNYDSVEVFNVWSDLKYRQVEADYRFLKYLESIREGRSRPAERTIEKRIKLIDVSSARNYFYQLLSPNKNGTFWNKEEIDLFFKMHFECFGDAVPVGKFRINIKVGDLCYFLGNFYDSFIKECNPIKKEEYALLVKDWFLNFEGWEVKTIYGKFKKLPSYYPF